MSRKLATTLILVLTASLALISSASARFIPEPGASPHSISKAVASRKNASGFSAQGSPLAYIGTRYAGDPAAHRAQPVGLGGGGSYATAPTPGSNSHVPGLQP